MKLFRSEGRKRVHACSVMSDLATPRTVAHEAPLFMESSRQEYWSGLPFPPTGDLSNPGIGPTPPVSPALVGGFFITEPPGNTQRGNM